MRLSGHRMGRTEAPIRIVGFVDFECVPSARAQRAVREVLDVHEKDVQYLFRHFPRLDIHRSSGLAALAAEAAGQQGKFWEMHDLLFRFQDELNPRTIFFLAEELGLDIARFQEDLESEQAAQRVVLDLREGERQGVVSTPRFFLNQSPLVGPAEFEHFARAIAAIKRRAA